MDKAEVLKSLAKLFNETEGNDKVTEEKSVDQSTFLERSVNIQEEFIHTHPDYDSLISILKYYNTRSLNYVVKKLDENKRKFFIEFSDSEKEKFLNEARDFYKRLVGVNSKSLPLLESMIVDWVDDLLK